MTRLSISARPRALLGSLALLSAALVPGLAFADTTDCTTIVSLPSNITVPGRYCLATGLSTASTAAAKIDIRTSNVLLDCNQNEVAYTGAPGTNGIGVRISGKSDVTVRNCRLLNFNTGIDATSAHRVLLDGNQIDGSRVSGIRITGTENEVRDNLVSNTAGANGIRVDAFADSSAQVRGNTVRSVSPASGTATGIRVGGAGRVALRDNVIREIGNASSTVSSAVVVASSSALVPSPVVVMNGAMFKGEGSKNYAVQTLASTAKVVCEGTAFLFYTPPFLPGCL